MKRVYVISAIVGLLYFIFGTLCLAAPFFIKCESCGVKNSGLLTLDEVGVFMGVIGSVLYGLSLIAIAVSSPKPKTD